LTLIEITENITQMQQWNLLWKWRLRN